ncbi:MAG: 6-phosphogluconolactonase [Alphaproteobacteria bacterium RIFCSPHIGHO2_12_FULL_63_12]|nr:MAG: 6-phosphogluconolactonase [Alphaproteobacteria bacterium RIFCSPHIGHO2_12_FULL_63_12]
MESEPELIVFASRASMAERVADLVEGALASGIMRDGRGELAVSGGSTPEGLYRTLARRKFAWSDVTATLVDERWVGRDHPRSNEAFIREAFRGADMDIVGLYAAGKSPAPAAANDISSRLQRRKKPFDAVVLGMGEDGHTASWFPHAKGLDVALGAGDRVCAITAEKSAVTGEEVDRMTLTLSALSDAATIILMIAGENKRATFAKAKVAGPVEAMPVRAILRARPDLWVCWAP